MIPDKAAGVVSLDLPPISPDNMIKDKMSVSIRESRDMSDTNRSPARPAIAIMVLMLAVDGVPAAAQPDDDRARAAATLENGRLEAASYAIRLAAAGDQQPVELRPESLLQWHNSVNQSVFGNIFVWTRAGRPEAVASIYRFFSPKVEFAAEFQSLSLSPLVIEKNGEEIWTPREPGIVLHTFADAPQPSQSKSQRLVQMRQLADQFAVQLTDWSEETYPLRLMPRPLFRYESTDPELLDGALFAFTYTTDPELLVMIEARKSVNGFRWMYGHARMNVGALTVTCRDQEVWTADRLEHPYLYKDGIYTLFMGLDLPVPDSTTE
jgi:hypothetical protein